MIYQEVEAIAPVRLCQCMAVIHLAVVTVIRVVIAKGPDTRNLDTALVSVIVNFSSITLPKTKQVTSRVTNRIMVAVMDTEAFVFCLLPPSLLFFQPMLSLFFFVISIMLAQCKDRSIDVANHEKGYCPCVYQLKRLMR